MLQETIYKRKDVGTLRRGFYFIQTTRAVWDRVQVVSRNRRYVRLLFLATERYRTRRGRRSRWRSRKFMRLEDVPIGCIITAQRYTTE